MGGLVDFVPFDPENAVHVAELTRQRILCGWNVQEVGRWCDKIRKGDKVLWWLFRGTSPEALERFKQPLPDEEVGNFTGQPGPPRPNPDFAPIGHVGLDWIDQENGMSDPDLGDRSRGLVIFSSFFILLSQQGLGLGNAVIEQLETLAASPSFGAKAITLHTLDRDDATNPDIWEGFGGWEPSRRVNEDWYSRKGYRVFKRGIPRYTETANGVTRVFRSVYMRKDIVQSA